MHRANAILPNAGDLRWDNQSLSSDDSTLEVADEHLVQLATGIWESSNGHANLHAGQLSPASTSMDIHMDGPVEPTMTNSAPSSCTESWVSGNVDHDEAEPEIHWEQSSDGVLAVPKLEPLEDDFNFDALKHTPLAPATSTEPSGALQTKQKRPRGRPRKHPIAPVANTSKITKGRSKTGCITCRKRKKKCDEAKPRCMNCEKNAVVCEGYHEKQIWKSGRERAEEERIRRESFPSITLQPLFHGVETAEDKIFWRHYINSFSNVLTVETESKNAFKDIILHLANRHQGLMHSILSVSSRHIDLDTPYGIKLLQDNPSTDRQALEERSDYHHDEAMKRFYDEMADSVDKDDPAYHTEGYQSVLCARYGQILFRLLQTRVEGNSTGEHRLHLRAYQTLIQHSPPEDPAFYAFITEFFQYHIYADDLIWHPDTRAERLSSDDWEPINTSHSPRLLGVVDGLLRQLSGITNLRMTIRSHMTTGVDPPVDYIMLFHGAEISTAIHEWTPDWPAGDSRNRVGLLYKQVMFIYLFRTIYTPSSMPRTTMSSLSSLSSSVSSTPQRRASMATSVVSTASAPASTSTSTSYGRSMPHSCPSSRNPSRNSSMHEGDNTFAIVDGPASPPPRRRPENEDVRLSTAVEESLQILEAFGPMEPAQTLLLIPCFVVGIACFTEEPRARVRRAIKTVRGYTGLRHCDRVAEVLEEVWRLMDEGDWVSVWDWQGIARRLEVDIPCT